MRRIIFAAVVAIMGAGTVRAASREVQYAPAASWVAPPPAPTAGPAPAGAPVRFGYLDQQTRLDGDTQENFLAYRVKILGPDGLGAGNTVVSWYPDTDDMIVHTLRIVRDGKTIDVTKGSKFRVLEPDNASDVEALNGNLVARLQVPGLQVGDELEFAASVRRKDSVFDHKGHGWAQLQPLGLPGAYRVRVVWRDGLPLRWKATTDLGPAVEKDVGGFREISYELRDPTSVIVADKAPARYNLRRAVEFTEFSSWAEISNAFAAFVEKAALLKPGSAVAEKADEIAKANPDPRARAEAALALVQDQVRYVYIGLGGGNYRPATADETWSRRFGDCKAKTVLLLAILHRLGIQSEAVLVNSKAIDGTGDRLPTPDQFDHVLVRATVDGKAYWLDGTKLDQHRLSAIPAPTFRWALPVRLGQVALEPVPAEPPLEPQFSQVVNIDAHAGFDVPAKVRLEFAFRGDEAVVMKRQLSALSGEDAQRQLKAYFHDGWAWVDVKSASWRFDDFEGAVLLTLVGEGKPAWEGNDKDGRSLTLIAAGFYPPDELKRPSEQDQSAPWTTDYPKYKRRTTVVTLPVPSKGWRWVYDEKPMHRKIGATSYWREVEMKDGVIRSTESTRDFKPEITAVEARDENAQITGFDNDMSTVTEVRVEPGETAALVEVNDRVHDLMAERKLTEAVDDAQAGRLAEALAAADAARALEPEAAPILKTRADVLHRLGRHEDALENLEEAHRINPLDASTTTARERELHELGRSDPPAQ